MVSWQGMSSEHRKTVVAARLATFGFPVQWKEDVGKVFVNDVVMFDVVLADDGPQVRPTSLNPLLALIRFAPTGHHTEARLQSAFILVGGFMALSWIGFGEIERLFLCVLMTVIGLQPTLYANRAVAEIGRARSALAGMAEAGGTP